MAADVLPLAIVPDDLISTADAAAIARATPGQVVRWVKSGRLAGWRRLGRWFVSRADVEALFTTAGEVTAAARAAAAQQPTRRERTRRQKLAAEYLDAHGYA